MAEEFEFVAMQAGETTQGVCIHCNQCMPTIYTGTRCTVLSAT